jgi:aspartyl-tRNA synthetase
MTSREESSLPTRPKEEQANPEAPSKNALKKAAKDKEKAEKAAKRQEQERQEREKAEANDTAKHLYGGSLPSSPPESQHFAELSELYDAKEDQEVTVDVRVHNARVQSAKLAFLVLREEAHTIQAVIGEGGPHKISRQMVKWCGGINSESIIRVTGLVKEPKEPVTSTSISNFELHVQSIYLISEAVEKLPVQVKDCMRPPPIGEENHEESEVDSQGIPVVSLSTRLNNRVLDVRVAANQAIFQLQGGISNLFIEYMNQHDFRWIQSSKIVGAATEGGSGVFEIKYFDSKAYLTQSPQFFKQMAIAMDMKRVCEIGPVFRAENSNTHRHLTEASAS